MKCEYCDADIYADAHRCARCGRKLQDGGRLTPVTKGSLAPSLEPSPDVRPEIAPARPQLVTSPPVRRGDAEAPTQASLFGPVEVPRAMQPPPKPAPPPSPRLRRGDRPVQRQLQFEEAQATRSLQTSVEAAIYCDAPVAIASQRVMAAVIDYTTGLAGFALFGATLHFAGAPLEFHADSVPYYAAAGGLLLLFYRILFCVANADTPGLRAAGLRLINFDGHAPAQRERLLRLAGGCIGVMAAGLGLVWSLVDEERLTWHDLMSKTFPTPVGIAVRKSY